MARKLSVSITRGILYGFTCMMLLFIGYGIFSYVAIGSILDLARTIYSNPLAVSNSSLAAKANILKMHIKMKDILILKNPEEIQSTIYEINALERYAYSELSTVEKNILGDEGKKKALKAIHLMDEWKPVNSRILNCVKNLDFDTAAELSRKESAIHILRLEAIMTELNTYARNMATGFIMESKRLYGRAEELTVLLGILWVLLSVLIILFTIKRAGSTERLLAQEKERFEKTFHSVPVWIVISSLDEGRFIEVNEIYLKDMGLKRADVIGKTSKVLESFVDPGIRDSIIREIKETGRVREKEVLMKTGKGNIIDTVFSAEILLLDGKEMMLSVTRDITEQKKAEKERDKLQRQFIQAQKMESVGCLAGGVAHDFNNMLGVIIGYTELALEKEPNGTPLHSDLTEIMNAANRSAEITRQLLAFARKQTINPRVIDLNNTVESMLKMIRRLIGEDIDLVWLPCPSLSMVNIDPMQVDQILANLCINARDAIQGVGRIIIETSHAEIDGEYCLDHAGFIPGRYVMLSVSDSGMGMDSSLMSNIFDPFFTTKGVGQGTGLGLATVYGIAKQNEGFINVYSEKGHGATFKIYLPQHSGDAAEPHTGPETVISTGRGETVLIVEDDPAILKIGKRILEQLEYRVLEASTPVEAINLSKGHIGKIDLLVTDVIMPEMNGRDLADRLKIIQPDLKVLYMSGYTANVIAHRGILERGVNFIQKPFTKAEFGAMIRRIIEGQ
ncbi:MAG: response regulator [Deltaproteobacteria bacterium]|nr:response regulator [Deltaproteobacteria bacterium]